MSFLHTIQNRLLDRVNDLRSLHYKITGRDFRELFEFSQDFEQFQVHRLIENLDIKGVEIWIAQQRVKLRRYNQMTLGELKRLSAWRKIPGYSCMVRVDLIIALEEYDERERSRSRNVGHQSVRGDVPIPRPESGSDGEPI